MKNRFLLPDFAPSRLGFCPVFSTRLDDLLDAPQLLPEVGTLFSGDFSDGSVRETASDYGVAQAGKGEMLLFAQPCSAFLSGLAESVHAFGGRIGGNDVRVCDWCFDDVQKMGIAVGGFSASAGCAAVFKEPSASGDVLIWVFMKDEDDVFFGPIICLGDEASDGCSEEALAAQGQPWAFDDDGGHRSQLALSCSPGVVLKGLLRARKSLLTWMKAHPRGLGDVGDQRLRPQSARGQLGEDAGQRGAGGAEENTLTDQGVGGEAEGVVIDMASSSFAEDRFNEDEVGAQRIADAAAGGIGIVGQLACEEVGDPSGVGAERSEQGCDCRLESLWRAGTIMVVVGGGCRAGELLPGFSLDRRIEAFFAVKVVAESGNVDTGELADFPNVAAVEAAPGKDLAGDFEDPLFGEAESLRGSVPGVGLCGSWLVLVVMAR